jgi:hypothetical protein
MSQTPVRLFRLSLKPDRYSITNVPGQSRGRFVRPATAILTAALASVLSSPNGSPLTRIALDKLYTKTDVDENPGPDDSETKREKIIQHSRVRQQEDAFLVIQH